MLSWYGAGLWVDGAEWGDQEEEVEGEDLQSGAPVLEEQVFRDVCSNFTPAMKFSRSVATNSIVGHVLGMGDRHTTNMLIDNSTGELVHIDLGVAFELRKILPTPETNPFRLTSEINDGFGRAGVEGVFRHWCERSKGVLCWGTTRRPSWLCCRRKQLIGRRLGCGRSCRRRQGSWFFICVFLLFNASVQSRPTGPLAVPGVFFLHLLLLTHFGESPVCENLFPPIF